MGSKSPNGRLKNPGMQIADTFFFFLGGFNAWIFDQLWQCFPTQSSAILWGLTTPPWFDKLQLLLVTPYCFLITSGSRRFLICPKGEADRWFIGPKFGPPSVQLVVAKQKCTGFYVDTAKQRHFRHIVKIINLPFWQRKKKLEKWINMCIVMLHQLWFECTNLTKALSFCVKHSIFLYRIWCHVFNHQPFLDSSAQVWCFQWVAEHVQFMQKVSAGWIFTQ